MGRARDSWSGDRGFDPRTHSLPVGSVSLMWPAETEAMISLLYNYVTCCGTGRTKLKIFSSVLTSMYKIR